MSTNNLFIVGAHGTIGTKLLQELGKTENRVHFGDVVASVLPGQSLRESVPNNARIDTVELDLAQPETLTYAFKNTTTAVFLPHGDVHHNGALVGRAYIDAMQQCGVSTCVMLSCAKAEEGGKRLKEWIALEEYLLKADDIADKIIVRSPLLFEDLTLFTRAMVTKSVLPLSWGHGKCNPLAGSDVAKCILQCAMTEHLGKHRGHTYTLTGSQMLSGDDIAKLFQQVLGLQVRFNNPDRTATETYLRQLPDRQVPESTVQRFMELFDLIQAGKLEFATDTYQTLLGDGAEPLTLDKWCAQAHVKQKWMQVADSFRAEQHTTTAAH
ncbi:hypothetical protein RI367_002801 [Sorochytrium milnesiophthora]